MAMIETRGLTRKYGDFVAVDRLDLTVDPGEVFGLLGPNGAGKTTTILMLLGLTEPTAGIARVAGYDPTRQPLAVKRITGYMPDQLGFYDELSGADNLRFTAALNHLPRGESEERIAQVLDRVGLADAATQRVGTYSRGMRQRLGLADVLLKAPRVIILDEPTLGIDPEGARDFLRLIRTLAKDDGITVMLSSHLLHQVQAICDRVGIFVRGRMVACGAISQLAEQLARHESFVLELQTRPQDETTLAGIRDVQGVDRVEPQGEILLVTAQRDIRGQLVRHLLAADVEVLHLRLLGHSLDDIYRRYFQGVDGGVPAA